MSELQCPFLREADLAFTAAGERFTALAATLDQDQANWSPDPKMWSVANCTDHLVVASDLYLAKLEPALEKAATAGRTGSEPYGRGTLVGRFLLGVLDPERPKFKAVSVPKVFRPGQGVIDFQQTGEAFVALRERWRRVLHLADGLDLGRIKLATPVSPLLRLSAAQAILVHVYHEPRHLAQAERLTRHADFPGAAG